MIQNNTRNSESQNLRKTFAFELFFSDGVMCPL